MLSRCAGDVRRFRFVIIPRHFCVSLCAFGTRGYWCFVFVFVVYELG